jgi:hypothetical protein
MLEPELDSEIEVTEEKSHGDDEERRVMRMISN